RDLDGVRGAAVRALPPGAGWRPRRRAGAGAHVPLDRACRARLRRDRDRGLRRAGGVGLPHAARLRHRDGRGPDRLAARSARRAAVGARARRARRAAAAHRAAAPAAHRVRRQARLVGARRVSGRGSWIAVVAGLAILAYITWNTLTTPATSSTGLA